MKRIFDVHGVPYSYPRELDGSLVPLDSDRVMYRWLELAGAEEIDWYDNECILAFEQEAHKMSDAEAALYTL